MNATSQYLNRPLRTLSQVRKQIVRQRLKAFAPSSFKGAPVPYPRLVKSFNPPIEPLGS